MATASFYGSDTLIPLYIVDENNINEKRAALLTQFETVRRANLLLSQNWDATFVNDLFKMMSNELVQLETQNIVIEATPDESVLVKSDIRGKRLYIELFLTDETPLNYDAVANLYENQKHIFGTAGSLEKVFEKVNKML